eukprot:8972889-Alexandrium_andersonii.AAC.1
MHCASKRSRAQEPMRSTTHPSTGGGTARMLDLCHRSDCFKCEWRSPLNCGHDRTELFNTSVSGDATLQAGATPIGPSNAQQ